MHERECQRLAEHYLDLYNMAYTLLHEPTDAEDAVQEALVTTMTKAWVKDPYTYCCRVLRNYCYDQLRRKKIVLCEHMPERNEVDAPVNEILIDQVVQMKKTFPKRTQMLLELYYEHDYSFSMIAERTGLSISTVRKIINRTLRQLRKRLIAQNTQPIDEL